MQTSAGRKSGALFTHLALVTKYVVVGEIHKDSDPMAERSATVTRRVQPARGKRLCEAETSERSTGTQIRWQRGLQPSHASNDVKPEVLLYLDTFVEGCNERARSDAEGKRLRAMVCGCEQGALRVACGGEAAIVASC